MNPFIKKLNEVGIEDVPEVGGKNASLGEMIKNLTTRGVKIPGGFAVSASANDLTQLTVGIDRDGNEMIRGITNENDESVKKLIAEIIKKCKEKGKYIGICGQAPSDIEGLAEFLVEQGIESISLNPDTVIKTTLKIYEQENKRHKEVN